MSSTWYYIFINDDLLYCINFTMCMHYIHRYGVGTGDIGLTQVQCGADDNHILRCSAMGIGTITSTTCNHTHDVGINCCKDIL